MDDLTPLAEGAAQLHELFVEYVRAGFTEAQAMQLIVAMITANTRRDGP
jgi:hypothetical protein